MPNSNLVLLLKHLLQFLKHICGVEIDPEQYKKCLQKLNSLAKKRGINGVRWNIVNEDYLKWECDRKFEFIVGNPPYITYQTNYAIWH